jgi:hypothetical protein
MREETRRRLLRSSGVVGLFGLAGCLGGTQSADTVEGSYEPWLIHADNIASAEHILLTSVDFDAVRSHSEHLERIDTSQFETADGIMPIKEVAFQHSFGSLIVTTGTFEADPINDRLSERYSTSERYQGYTVYGGNDAGGALAVKEGHFLKSIPYEGADVMQNLKNLIDTGEGNIERGDEVSDSLATLTSHLGDEAAVRIDTEAGAVEDSKVTGAEVTLGEEDTELKAVAVFGDSPAEEAVVRSRVEERSFLSDAADVSTTTEDEAVIVEGTVATAQLPELQVRFD